MDQLLQAQASVLGYTYIAYVLISLGLTIWVGRTLNQNGRIFLKQNYDDNPALVDAISNMLLVGFYLINIGFVSYTLRTTETPASLAGGIELLSTKIGLIAIILGIMHFGLMIALQRLAGIIKQVMPVATNPAPEVMAAKT